jgi:hypothetical protein
MRDPIALKVYAMCCAVWALGMTTEALAGLISWPIAGLAMVGWIVIFSADYWRRERRDRRRAR